MTADAWYEWKKDLADPKRNQPYFIRLKSKKQMFFATIGQFQPATQKPSEDDGLVIIFTAADAEMIGIHDRRPQVLTPDVLRKWIDPELVEDRATEISREEVASVNPFEWYSVSKSVGSVKNDGPNLLTLIDKPLL